MPTRLQSATPGIIRFFDASEQRVFSMGQIGSILSRQQFEWKLPASTSLAKFLDFLLSKTHLRRVRLESHYGVIVRYVWGDVSPYSIGLSLKGGSYLSHGTAVSLHALTDQIPKTIYVNREQSAKPRPTGVLTQFALDRALSSAQRRSKYILRYESWQLVLLSGKHTNSLGVVDMPDPEKGKLRVTGLERTLIDIVVRPDYAGGVHRVFEAYKSARERMSANAMMATLKKLNYVYPYHQAIGFYMQKAGYERERWERFKRLPMEFDFYLAHGLREKSYDASWHLFVPKGFE